MNSTYVYIGRFQLPHIGHELVIKKALEKTNELILLVGSSNATRNKKNPFLYIERKEMLEKIVKKYSKDARIYILPLPDFKDDTSWVDEIKRLVSSVASNNEIVITGCRKKGDDSTYYLHIFPDFKSDLIEEINVDSEVVSSTQMRNIFYSGKIISPTLISDEVRQYLEEFKVKNIGIYNDLKK